MVQGRRRRKKSIPQYGCEQVATSAKVEVKPRELELMLKRRRGCSRRPETRVSIVVSCLADACDASADYLVSTTDIRHLARSDVVLQWMPFHVRVFVRMPAVSCRPGQCVVVTTTTWSGILHSIIYDDASWPELCCTVQ